MAVLVKAISVIVRADSVAQKFPGGWERFRGECPNNTLCADGELARVGFMTPHDVKSFIGHLSTRGLTYLADGTAQDIIVADQQRGLAAACNWAEFGRVDFRGERGKQVAACRLNGSTVNELVTPEGWNYDASISSQFIFVESGWTPEFMDFVRHENGLDVYRDLKTGKEVYVGRASA
jgi:hypothetical protein